MDQVLKRIFSEFGVSDPEGLLESMTAAGYEPKHSEMLQCAKSLGFPSLEHFWLHHHGKQTSFTELEALGFSRTTLHRSKTRTLGRLTISIAAQSEIWGEE